MTNSATSAKGRPAVKPMIVASTAEASMIAVRKRSRPQRTAASLPRMLAGTPSRMVTVPMTAASAGTTPAGAPSAKARKATSQARKPNSSQQWAA